MVFDAYTAADQVDGLDLVFLGLPHGASQEVAPELIGRVGGLVDLAADFRLTDASLYPTWYGSPHARPDLLGRFAFGLPELFRDEIAAATEVAAPGCYVTTATLALAPLLRAGWSSPPASWSTPPAARPAPGGDPSPPPPSAPSTRTSPPMACSPTATRPRSSRPSRPGGGGADVQIVFTPHMAPMNRGILATCYARPASRPGAHDRAAARGAGRGWRDEPFVVAGDRSPSTKATLGSNAVHVTARADERTGWVSPSPPSTTWSKGASGQAVQCANILAGLPETTGLATRASTRERHRRQGLRRQRRRRRGQGSGALDLSLVATADGPRSRRPPSSRRTWWSRPP
jgi:N-acetyl-gamma-glutamyl-phosphate reductase